MSNWLKYCPKTIQTAADNFGYTCAIP
ncbi:hypothetical protein CAEBREN_19226 [Caenorhabditis brenneri]|uniref:Uncharacterized protein n=1 Tax=Caenorhabditis brenneri TaxID=135651 RepID=G0MQS0_CAEBE|nr:hypothetical protein CAEBREN_19226 [Caenorhabditis brenneri]